MSASIEQSAGGSGGPERSSATGVSQEIAFEMLSCRRRRHVLHFLKQRGETVTLRELSTKIASWENDISPEAVTYDQRTRVYTALRQSHLPKMDRAGIVNYDPDAGTIELTEGASELEVYLDVVPHEEIPWSKFYVGLGVLCCGSVLAAFLDVIPFSVLPDIGWAATVALLLLTVAITHWYHEKQNRLGTEGSPPV